MPKHWTEEIAGALADIEAKAQAARVALSDRIKQSEADSSATESPRGRLSEEQVQAFASLLEIVGHPPHGKRVAFDDAVGRLAGVKGTTIKDTRLGWTNAEKSGLPKKHRRRQT